VEFCFCYFSKWEHETTSASENRKFEKSKFKKRENIKGQYIFQINCSESAVVKQAFMDNTGVYKQRGRQNTWQTPFGVSCYYMVNYYVYIAYYSQSSEIAVDMKSQFNCLWISSHFVCESSFITYLRLAKGGTPHFPHTLRLFDQLNLTQLQTNTGGSSFSKSHNISITSWGDSSNMFLNKLNNLETNRPSVSYPIVGL